MPGNTDTQKQRNNNFKKGETMNIDYTYHDDDNKYCDDLMVTFAVSFDFKKIDAFTLEIENIELAFAGAFDDFNGVRIHPDAEYIAGLINSLRHSVDVENACSDAAGARVEDMANGLY